MEKNGIWQFDTEEKTSIITDRAMLDTNAFIYNNNSVILKIYSISIMQNAPIDDIYRLQVKWKNNDAYIFLPSGYKWELFATWENNRFIILGDNRKKIFKKIQSEEIPDLQKELVVREYSLWEYEEIIPDDINIE